MLGLGKNPNEEKSQTQAGAESSPSPSNSPQQPGEANTTLGIEGTSGPKALTESETIAREIKDGTLSGFVASGTFVTGEATFKAMLRIDGRFSGRITSEKGSLIVGAGGRVDATIEVPVVTIQGIVNGDVIASQRVELGRAARLTGNIQTPSLLIEQGAIFEGTCGMTQQQAAEGKPVVQHSENGSNSSKAELVTVDTSNKNTDGSNKKLGVTGLAAAH